MACGGLAVKLSSLDVEEKIQKFGAETMKDPTIEVPAEAAQVRHYAVEGAILLLIAVICPFWGQRGLSFTDLLHAPLGSMRLMAILPIALALGTLVCAFAAKALMRAVLLLLGIGLSLILLAGSLDSLMRGMVSGPSGQTINLGLGFWVMVAFVLLFMALSYLSVRPGAGEGRMLAALSGTVLLAGLLVPVAGDSTPLISFIFKSELWHVAWFVPVSLIGFLGFSLVGVAMLFHYFEEVDLIILGRRAGMVVLVVPVIGAFFVACPFTWVTLAAAVIKFYGLFLGVGLVFGAGALELMFCSFKRT